MCGRFASSADAGDLALAFDAALDGDGGSTGPGPSWNVAPTDAVRVVLSRPPHDEPDAEPQRVLRTARWGLVPGWAKDPTGGARLINARSETVDSKPSFRRAAGARRCLVPADGYYEWQKTDRKSVV